MSSNYSAIVSRVDRPNPRITRSKYPSVISKSKFYFAPFLFVLHNATMFWKPVSHLHKAFPILRRKKIPDINFVTYQNQNLNAAITTQTHFKNKVSIMCATTALLVSSATTFLDRKEKKKNNGSSNLPYPSLIPVSWQPKRRLKHMNMKKRSRKVRHTLEVLAGPEEGYK
jgi:hypothetical protein